MPDTVWEAPEAYLLTDGRRLPPVFHAEEDFRARNGVG